LLERYLTQNGRHALTIAAHILALIIISFIVTYDNKPPGDAELVSRFLPAAIEKIEDASLKIQSKVFYQQHNHQTVWHDALLINSNGRFLIDLLNMAEYEGLKSQDYIANIKPIHQVQRPVTIAEHDVRLTLAFVKYAQHMRNGRLPKNILDNYRPRHPEFINYFDLLKQGIADQKIFAHLYEQAPPHEQYNRLRTALAKLRQIKQSGGWPILPTNALLKRGMKDNRVIILRQRLKISGDLPYASAEAKLFDQELENAIEQFQRRHGILVDGIAGGQTLRTLNIPVENRIQQVLINMEHWRYVQRNFAAKHILVNAAGFELIGVKGHREALNMRVIVGKKDLPTPLFSSQITHVVLNPEWVVPRSIAVKEILRYQKTNPNFLTQNQYVLLSGWNENETVINPESLNWQQLNDQNFPYHLKKPPGETNPLGRIKFVMPNQHDVYLHDTPHRDLFDNVFRDLSHGCIRLQHPEKLFEFVFREDSTWNQNNLRDALISNQNLQINLAEPVPVYIVYFTTWIESDGRMNFYSDIYQHDNKMSTVLDYI